LSKHSAAMSLIDRDKLKRLINAYDGLPSYLLSSSSHD